MPGLSRRASDSGAVSAERRGAALGAWSGIAGFAVAMGPLVGGAVVEGISWQWVFWLNVPVGLILLPLATQLRESYGPDKHLDIPGVVLGGLGLLGLVWGLVNGNSHGWTSPQIVAALVAGAERLRAEEMADRVDREGHVLEEEDPYEAGPDHRLEAALPASADEVAGEERKPERQRDPEQVKTIDRSHEPVVVQVAPVLDPALEALCGEEPTDMRVPEPDDVLDE